jgi:hypothetical protein
MMKKSVTRLSFLMVTTLVLAFLMTPITLIQADKGQAPGPMGVPGMPDNALQFNRTDLTPVCHREQITANTMHAFAFKNVTLLMNCSRNTEMNITIDPSVRTRYLALVMEQNQSTRLTMNVSVSLPSGVMTMLRTLNFYWGIEPNATLQLHAQLRLHINGTALNAELNRVVNASRLRWMYWNRSGEEWVPVESYLNEDGYLVCETTHFSTWTVAELIPLQVNGSLSKTDPTVGEAVTVSATVKDEEDVLVEDASVEAQVGSITIQLTDNGGGNYQGSLDVSTFKAGIYDVGISAVKVGYLMAEARVTLNVQAATLWITYAAIGLVVGLIAMATVILLRKR